MYTQPLLYRKIANHPTVREHYTGLLARRGMMTVEECAEVAEKYDAELRAAMEASREEAKRQPALAVPEVTCATWSDEDWCDTESPATAVEPDRIVDLISRTNAMPEGHVVHPNLLRQLKRREEMVGGNRDLDWGCAETAAMASLVTEGVPIRLIGQDSGRGTFSHRHAVIRDQQSGEDYMPLDTLNDDAHFEVRDSLLSEEAVLAFEYGYSLAAPATMGIWEAQFGDFANGAQIPIDQFLASGEEKWGQRVGLTMLLPHGYDGQGPEHSNARPERFLQLCAEGNFTVANCSTAAQYFHLLRRQGLSESPVPLVVFTPKSLLRDPRAASPVAELSEGNFKEVIADEVVDDSAIKRVVFCTGKVYHDLAVYGEENNRTDVALVRVEQLYPFPRTAINAIRERFADAEFVWCQEEPRNMGAWTFFMQRCGEVKLCPSYSGRPAAASPATGSYKRHHAEQARLLRCAFGDDK